MEAQSDLGGSAVPEETLGLIHLEETRFVKGLRLYTLVEIPDSGNLESNQRVAPGLTPIENPGEVT